MLGRLQIRAIRSSRAKKTIVKKIVCQNGGASLFLIKTFDQLKNSRHDLIFIADICWLFQNTVTAELSRAKRANGAPWVRKFVKLSIRENLVMTQRSKDCPYTHYMLADATELNNVCPCAKTGEVWDLT